MRSGPSPILPYSVPTFVALGCALLMVAGSLVSACDSGGGMADEEVLIPLEEGNTWTIEIKELPPPDGGDPEEERVSFRVDSEGNAVVFESTSGELRDTTVLTEKKSEGLLVGPNLENRDNFLLKFPVEAGDAYEYTDAEGKHTFQITVSRETVEVPAGTFKTLVYSIREDGRDTVDDRVYVKPGFGPVRWDYFPGNPGFDAGYQLLGSNVERD